eukprot:Pompholyxophrys_punicea_v1_NODE_958_length_1097_cov_10.704415.p2 type:complete len:169 gc:universal NODE_958_length_1097_cov_10.704415:575-69(-)
MSWVHLTEHMSVFVTNSVVLELDTVSFLILFLNQRTMVVIGNRKQFPSINCLAVCDESGKFTFVDVGSPGSLHDARIFKRSELFDMMLRRNMQYFPNICYLLGDSAYPLLPWLLTPFPERAQMQEFERIYNRIHSSMRMTIERAFGKLKGRFRILHYGVESPNIPTVC